MGSRLPFYSSDKAVQMENVKGYGFDMAIKMRMRENIEKAILRTAEKILPCTTFDRLLIERRRRINKVTGYYPQAVFFSKKRSKKKYCVVRFTTPTFALMAAGIQYVFCYYQLVERGNIPLLDLEGTYTYKQGQLGKNNVWDMLFKQPISVREATDQPYVLATGDFFSYSDNPQICMDLNNDEKDHFIHVKKDNYREYYAKAKKYTDPIWQVKDEVIEELDAEIWNRVKDYRVLGVFLREDFSRDVHHQNKADEIVYSNHPLLPGVKEIIAIIKDELLEWKYDFIFVSTMYIDSLKLFQEEFGNKVICLKRERRNLNDIPPTNFDSSERKMYEEEIKNQSSYKEKNKTYLKEMVALSRCSYFVGGPSSGAAAVLTMNGGKYDDIYILEDVRKIKRY